MKSQKDPRLEPDEAGAIRIYIAGLRARHEGAVAVFDLGTKAVRLLVAPKTRPDDWGRDTFRTFSRVPALGAHLDRQRRLDLGSDAFRALVAFVSSGRDALLDAGLQPGEIVATGTAVFREMSNQAQVLAAIRQQTGVDVDVLPERAEAFLSLAAVGSTYRLRARGLPAKIDAVLLLDQGGGSLEVSYFPVDDASLAAADKLHSFATLGTVFLRERFFKLGARGQDVEPEQNRAGVSAQKNRVIEFVAGELAAWPGFPELLGKTVVAYGMGSAITHCFSKQSNHDVHNSLIAVAELDGTVENLGRGYDASGRQVRTLYTHMTPKIDDDLSMLCGLPAYTGVLKRFGLEQIRVAGYGLRFGVYLWRFVLDRPFAELA